jgi:hypothetical protein
LDNAGINITASCVIRENRIYRNGELFWEGAGTLPDFFRGAYDMVSGQYPKFHKMDPLSKLGWLAAEVLLKDFDKGEYAPEQVGMVLANRSSSLDTDLRYYDSVKEFPSPALFVYTLPNIVMGEISIRHGFKGENIFFTANSFDTGLIAAYVKQLFSENAAAACLCGWVEVMDQQYEVLLYLIEKKHN